MKRRHLLLGLAAVLAGGGLWFANSGWRTHRINESRAGDPQGREANVGGAGFEAQREDGPRMSLGSNGINGQLQPRQMLRPPEPNRRFADFTPEQRVQFARQGHGPGG